MLGDPGLEIAQLAEVDDEAVYIGLAAGEGQRDRPVVPVDECAMACMPVLTVREGNVPVGFFTSEHGEARGEKVGKYEGVKV